MLAREIYFTSRLLNDMSHFTYFKRNGAVEGWALGNASFNAQDCDAVKETITDEDHQKLFARTHQPVLENGKIKFVNRLDFKDMTERKRLREKIKQAGSLTPAEIQQALKLIL